MLLQGGTEGWLEKLPQLKSHGSGSGQKHSQEDFPRGFLSLRLRRQAEAEGRHRGLQNHLVQSTALSSLKSNSTKLKIYFHQVKFPVFSEFFNCHALCRLV